MLHAATATGDQRAITASQIRSLQFTFGYMAYVLFTLLYGRHGSRVVAVMVSHVVTVFVEHLKMRQDCTTRNAAC